MKTIFATGKILLLTVFIATYGALSAQTQEKKITIIEKDGSQADNTELTITYSNFTSQERANLIQQLLETKNCKVEVKHTTETTAYNSGQTSAAQMPVPTGVSNVSVINKLQLYPNPNKGEFHIAFSTDKPSDVKLRIIDMNGKEVYSEKVKNSTGDFNKDISIRSSVSSGTYILEAESNGQKVTTQVVVQ